MLGRDWFKEIGVERKKGGAIVTYTVPIERVESWWRRLWRKVRG